MDLPFFVCAPDRAHSLGGASPLHTLLVEVLVGRQVSEDFEVNIVRYWLKLYYLLFGLQCGYVCL